LDTPNIQVFVLTFIAGKYFLPCFQFKVYSVSANVNVFGMGVSVKKHADAMFFHTGFVPERHKSYKSQMRNRLCEFLIAFRRKVRSGMGVRLRNYKVQGSITAEVAFAFPIFFFGLMFFLTFFQMIQVYTEVNNALVQTAQYAVKYTYLLENSAGEQNTDQEKENRYIKAEIDEYIGDKLEQELLKIQFCSIADRALLTSAYIPNGAAGVSFFKSQIMEQENDLCIVASYHMRLVFPFFPLPDLPVEQKVLTKAFLGMSMQDSGESMSGENQQDLVYVTETGSVYHSLEECTYLKPSIETVLFSSLENKRNENGAIYYPCDVCCKDNTTGNSVYITSWGTAYHKTVSCRELKRTIIVKNKAEAEKEGYRGCSKCSK